MSDNQDMQAYDTKTFTNNDKEKSEVKEKQAGRTKRQLYDHPHRKNVGLDGKQEEEVAVSISQWVIVINYNLFILLVADS